jgi:hypothetical protein
MEGITGVWNTWVGGCTGDWPKTKSIIGMGEVEKQRWCEKTLTSV